MFNFCHFVCSGEWIGLQGELGQTPPSIHVSKRLLFSIVHEKSGRLELELDTDRRTPVGHKLIPFSHYGFDPTISAGSDIFHSDCSWFQQLWWLCNRYSLAWLSVAQLINVEQDSVFRQLTSPPPARQCIYSSSGYRLSLRE